jgi:serine/threonine protein kinase
VLADFGLAAKYFEGIYLTQRCGTKNYMPPQVKSGKPYDLKADIWSVGQ